MITADIVLATLGQPNGIFFQPAKYDKDGKQITTAMLLTAPAPKNPGDIPRVEDSICKKTHGATTHWRSGRIFLCPIFFGLSPEVSPSQDVVQEMKLDDYFSASRLLLHELVHLWKNRKCSRR